MVEICTGRLSIYQRCLVHRIQCCQFCNNTSESEATTLLLFPAVYLSYILISHILLHVSFHWVFSTDFTGYTYHLLTGIHRRRWHSTVHVSTGGLYGGVSRICYRYSAFSLSIALMLEFFMLVGIWLQAVLLWPLNRAAAMSNEAVEFCSQCDI